MSLALGMACSREAPPPDSPAGPTAAPAAQTRLPVPASFEAPVAVPSCERLRERHQQRWQRPPAAHPNCLLTGEREPDAPFQCHSAEIGTWAIVASHDVWAEFEQLPADEDCFMSTPPWRLSLIFEHGGVELERPGVTMARTMHGGETPSITKAFDYDGDGRGEVVLVMDFDGEGDNSTLFSIYSAQGDAIVPYAPANGLEIEAFEDFDRDGRPDLVVPVHRAQTSNVGISGMHTLFPGLAHSLPGGAFSRDDDVARAFTAKHCAALPQQGPIVVKGGLRDDVASGHAIVCARRRGVAKAEILTALGRSCLAYSDDFADDPEKVPLAQPCPAWWKRWLENER